MCAISINVQIITKLVSLASKCSLASFPLMKQNVQSNSVLCLVYYTKNFYSTYFRGGRSTKSERELELWYSSSIPILEEGQ